MSYFQHFFSNNDFNCTVFMHVSLNCPDAYARTIIFVTRALNFYFFYSCSPRFLLTGGYNSFGFNFYSPTKPDDRHLLHFIRICLSWLFARRAQLGTLTEATNVERDAFFYVDFSSLMCRDEANFNDLVIIEWTLTQL